MAVKLFINQNDRIREHENFLNSIPTIFHCNYNCSFRDVFFVYKPIEHKKCLWQPNSNSGSHVFVSMNYCRGPFQHQYFATNHVDLQFYGRRFVSRRFALYGVTWTYYRDWANQIKCCVSSRKAAVFGPTQYCPHDLQHSRKAR